MGWNQSKEEVIIAQEGNSNSSETNSTNWTYTEMLGVASFFLVVLLFTMYAIRLLKKRLERKIQQEVRRSQIIV